MWTLKEEFLYRDDLAPNISEDEFSDLDAETQDMYAYVDGEE